MQSLHKSLQGKKRSAATSAASPTPGTSAAAAAATAEPEETDAAADMEEEGLAATEKEHHSCGPDCDCEELNRVRLRAACTDQNTHKIMCYMGNRTVTEFIQITILITGFFLKKNSASSLCETPTTGPRKRYGHSEKRSSACKRSWRQSRRMPRFVGALWLPCFGNNETHSRKRPWIAVWTRRGRRSRRN